MLAGVGLGSIIAGSCNWIFGFLSVLTIPRVAAAMAQNNQEAARAHIGQTMWIALIIGTCTSTLLLTQSPAIVSRAPPSLPPPRAPALPPSPITLSTTLPICVRSCSHKC